jgi:hypothetical protein
MCKFLRRGLPWTCDAYPDGVPRRFALGHEMHAEPAEGDHGIQFQMREDVTKGEKDLAERMIADHSRHKEAAQEGRG